MATGWLTVASSYSVLPKSLRTVHVCPVHIVLTKAQGGRTAIVVAPGGHSSWLCLCVSPASGDSGHRCMPSLHLHKQDTLSWETKRLFSQSQRLDILAAARSGSGGSSLPECRQPPSPGIFPWQRESSGLCLFVFFFFLIILFTYLFIFGCAGSSLLHRLSLLAVSGGYSSLWYSVFSVQWLLLLQSTGSRHVGSVVGAHGLRSWGTWAQELGHVGSVVGARGLRSWGTWAQ